MNLDLLSQHIVTLRKHSAQCKACQPLAAQNKEVIQLLEENRKDGLGCILLAECPGCQNKHERHCQRQLVWFYCF